MKIAAPELVELANNTSIQTLQNLHTHADYDFICKNGRIIQVFKTIKNTLLKWRVKIPLQILKY